MWLSYPERFCSWRVDFFLNSSQCRVRVFSNAAEPLSLRGGSINKFENLVLVPHHVFLSFLVVFSKLES